MNSSFIFLRPEVCTKAFVEFTVNFFEQANIRVDDVAVLGTDEVRRRHWVDQHYATVQAFAFADSGDLSGLIGNRPEVKSVFHAFFHELWDTVVAEGRLLTAKDAMVVLGNLSPRELSQRWWSNGDFHPTNTTTALCCSPVKLFNGLYIIRLAQEGNLYIVNGFYPAVYEACTALSPSGLSVCRLTVSWPESAYTWEQFATEVIGQPGDPNSVEAVAYPATSLRHALYHQNESFGVHMVKEAWAAPSRSESAPVVMSGLESASGPLEALAARCLWTNLSVEDDDFGRQILQEGVPPSFLCRLLNNPVLLQSGEVISVFDIAAGLTSSQTVRLISQLYVENEEQEKACQAAAPGAEEKPGTLSILSITDIITSKQDDKAKVLRDSAVLLVKPHAYNEKVFALIAEALQQEVKKHSLTVDSVVDIGAELVREKALVERHFSVEAHYAMDASPAHITLPPAVEEAFYATFGFRWPEVLAEGRVFNAAEALHTLGGLTPAQLYRQWSVEEEKHRKLKLLSGAWVCRVPRSKHRSIGKTEEFEPEPEEEPFFVVNGFYPHLRESFTTAGAKTRCYAVSWPEESEDAAAGKSFGTIRLENAFRISLLERLKEGWQELDLTCPPDSVNDGVLVSRGAAEAAIMRHVWLGVPFDEDPLYQDALRPRGISTAPLMGWLANPLVESAASPEKQRVLDFLAGTSTSEILRASREIEAQLCEGAEKAAKNRAMVLLHPPAATAKAIQHVRSVLSRGGISIRAEGDVFASEASARLLGTANMRAAAELASLAGEELLDAVSVEAKEAFRQTFKKDWTEFAEIITGAAAVCREFEITPTALMKKWSDCDPVRLCRHCHVAFMPVYQRYVVNGFYPYLEERYTSPGARVHYFDVAWKQSRWTWEDFSNVVIGDRDIACAAAGSLQRSISEGWRELGLQERPCHRAQVSVSASAGPLEAIADRAVWLGQPQESKVALEDRFLADPVTQRLVAEGVPVGTVAYYAAGSGSLVLDDTRMQERVLLKEVSTHQQTSECIRRLKTVSASIQSASKQFYGFFWLHPSCATPNFAAVIPELLSAHCVHIRSQGELSVDEAQERALLNGPLTALYRNAWVRTPAEIPVTAGEKKAFVDFFGMRWETAVLLSIVINAKEAATRFGETRIIRWWDETPRKVCLSSNLYVGYLEVEGIYVVNGFYPYVQSHLHSGSHRTMWFSVTWDAAQMTWDEFEERVIGDQDPAQAAEGSLRQHLHANWELYGLSAPTDCIENGVQASGSPLEAAADRCLWWNLQPEQDVLGRLLLQHGISVGFLYEVLQNPPVYPRGAVGSTIESIADAFALLPRDPVLLIRMLRRWQSATDITTLPAQGAAITSPKPLPLPKDDPESPEEMLTEAQQREALVACQATFTTAVYPALPLGSLCGDTLVGSAVAEEEGEEGTEEGEEGTEEDASAAAYAILSLSPTFVAPPNEKNTEAEAANVALVKSVVKDVLSRHGVSVVYEGTQSHDAAEERRLFDGQHRRLLQYAIHDSASDILAVSKYREALEKVFGDTFNPAGLRNAARLAETFDLTPLKASAVWKHCSPIVRLDEELFVGKVPAEDLFIVNGFALHERNAFYASPQPKHFMLVRWDERKLSYGDFMEKLVGDVYVDYAAQGSINAALRDTWQQLGFVAGPHPFLGAVHASNSALAAMHDRQLWMPQNLGFEKDPLGRRAINERNVSPYILQWALSNPREEPGSGSFAVGKGVSAWASTSSDAPPVRLMDVMALQGTDVTLRLLSSLEVNYRSQQDQECSAVRNTAFLLVKPHALGRRFGRCVEKVLTKHNIRIDEEGDITGTSLHETNLLRSLYPASAAYAALAPRDIVLSHKEKYFIEQTFGTAWIDMVFGGLVFNAYEALNKLGDFTPQQLYVCWRVSRSRMLVRPDLELTFLEGHDIYVVNGYFPALKQSFESPRALLHWYVVSWPESNLTWTQFQSNVVGHEDPNEASPSTIRGLLQAHWRRYGLHAMPDTIQNGLHVSSGPWHAMAERLKVVQPHIERDPFGDLLLRRKVHRGLIRAWLENPNIVACGITAGVFEHLAGYDTTQVADLVCAVSDNVRKIEKARKTSPSNPRLEAVGASSIEAAQTPESALMHPPPTSAELDVDRDEQYDLSDDDDDDAAGQEATVIHRNAAVLLVKPHLANCPPALQLLRDTLKKEHGIRILSETAKEGGSASASTARTLDQMYFTEAFYGLHSNFAAAASSPGSEFTSAGFRKRFAEAFGGAAWNEALTAGRVFSAAEAMQRLRLTAQDLYQAYSNEAAVFHVGRSLSFTKILVDFPSSSSKEGEEAAAAAAAPTSCYIANANYPTVREHLQYDEATGSEAAEMRAFVVAWDERQLSWQAFKEDVIGSEDPASAKPKSFRAELLRLWKALGLAAPPSLLDNGLRVSDGPLQAHAERIAWFGSVSEVIPDTLARSLAAADTDPTVLLEWSENPLVDDSNQTGVPRRLFDVLYNTNTSDVIAFARRVQDDSAQGCLDKKRVRVLTASNNLHPYQTAMEEFSALITRRPYEDPFHPQVPRHKTEAVKNAIQEKPAEKPAAKPPAKAAPPPQAESREEEAVSIPTATFTHRSGSNHNRSSVTGSSQDREVQPSAEPAAVAAAVTKPRQKLQAAKVKDALLHARTDAEVRQLWDYYRELDQANESADNTALKRLTGCSVVAAPKPTISSEAFKADFTSLEMFGAPLPKHQVMTLFATAEARGGRMQFDEFARAMAFYQAM